MADKRQRMDYRSAGVDIDRAEQLLSRIKSAASTTSNEAVIGGIGGFGALFDIGATAYKDPILVAGADGVGTKLKLAVHMNKHDTIGIDLVAMCVNDILVQGAQPLFFLDYFACDRLQTDQAGEVIAGIARGCKIAGCALIGGETAEMPGMYAGKEYELAGFCVGAVERGQLIDGDDVKAGDILIGVASSGPHANGYSLIRKIIDDSGADLGQSIDNGTVAGTLGEILITPTRIYTHIIKQLQQSCRLKALCHITGGGLTENLPRVIPDETQALINTDSWSWPPVFRWLQSQGNIETREMYRTFNCGVGMIACVAAEDADRAVSTLQNSGEHAWQIGVINAEQDGKPVCFASTNG